MNRLIPIKRSGQIVLTTAQLAESYGTDADRISKNFHENKIRFVEDKHFIKLEGESLLHFRNSEPQIHVSNMTRIMYLWTEKGAWLHAKSLNTDRAWEAYEMLVDEYYSIKQNLPAPMTQAELIAAMANQHVEQERRMSQMESQVHTLTTGLTAVPDHTAVVARVNEYARWARMGHNEVYNKVYDIMQARHGIDVRQRVENERDKLNTGYYLEKGRYYSPSTLKSKVNGIDVMVRNGWLGKFNEILVGMMAQLKERSLPTTGS
jgi:hypothetical protein